MTTITQNQRVVSETVELTAAEKLCMDAFREARKDSRPVPPTVQEVADKMGITKGYAGMLLRSLEIKGRLERQGRKSRTLVEVRKH